ncbi:hypothetical protein BKA12_001728 [Neomicrococcus lactis]|uniref:Uncharacterized protein n=1 Tax=Neomicrococcus lactis TaxID=732241 RepID=A0A7W8YBS8_9MICC|nr:hypothetical protein [Neomicrococcus lactis]
MAVVDNETFLRFRNAVERNYFRTRSVAVYARRLGYSARTRSRAALKSRHRRTSKFPVRRRLSLSELMAP